LRKSDKVELSLQLKRHQQGQPESGWLGTAGHKATGQVKGFGMRVAAYMQGARTLQPRLPGRVCNQPAANAATLGARFDKQPVKLGIAILSRQDDREPGDSAIGLGHPYLPGGNVR
jgi:hypothetical protein